MNLAELILHIAASYMTRAQAEGCMQEMGVDPIVQKHVLAAMGEGKQGFTNSLTGKPLWAVLQEKRLNGSIILKSRPK